MLLSFAKPTKLRIYGYFWRYWEFWRIIVMKVPIVYNYSVHEIFSFRWFPLENRSIDREKYLADLSVSNRACYTHFGSPAFHFECSRANQILMGRTVLVEPQWLRAFVTPSKSADPFEHNQSLWPNRSSSIHRILFCPGVIKMRRQF